MAFNRDDHGIDDSFACQLRPDTNERRNHLADIDSPLDRNASELNSGF